MKRISLLIVLSLFALLTLAAEPQPSGNGEGACKKTEQFAATRNPAGAQRVVQSPGDTLPPSRASSPTRTTPRWNSLLPGMFR